MERNKRRLFTGLAASGVLAGALACGGVALASTGSGHPAAVTAMTASSQSAAGQVGGSCTRKHGCGGLARRHPVVVRAAFKLAAAYVGLTPKELRAQLVSGKSLAQVATAQGKTASGLENAMLAAAVKAIDAHSGWTAARKAALIQRVQTRLPAIVNAKYPFGIGRHAAAAAGAATPTASAA